MTRVVIAEDYVPIREICLRLLAGVAEVVATAGNGDDAVSVAVKHRPDVVLLDVSMPGMNGFDAARRIRELVPDAAIIFISSHVSEAYIDAARALGAAGYVFKQRLVQDLATAVETTGRGSFFLSQPP